MSDQQYEEIDWKNFKANLPNPNPSHPRLEGWSDEIAIKIAQKSELPTDLHNNQAIVQRCARFLEFYCTGKIREGDSTLATIADMAFTAHNSEGFIFKPGKPLEPKETIIEVGEKTSGPKNPAGTSCDKDEKLLSTYDANKSTIDELEIIFQDNSSKTILKYDEKRLKNFMEHIANRLNPMLAGKLNLVELKIIVSLLSYLALVFFRAVIKDNKQLAAAFNKKSFSRTVYAITNWPLSYPFSPPCDLAISKACCALRKSEKYAKDLFAKIVIQWIEFQDEPNSKHALFLSSAVLDETKFNGMGLIDMVLKCEKILHLDWINIVDHSWYKGTDKSWEKIDKFFEEHVEGTKNLTCYWARVIDDRYFRDLPQKENPHLAGIFAGIIMAKDGDGILKAEWAKNPSDMMKMFFVKGKEVYEKFASS